VLLASRLTRRFGNRLAVEDVSFEIGPGEVFGLLGPNGAGKTTTLRMLGGLILPDEGHVAVDGVRIDRRTADRIRRRIGFLTETPGLWEQLTVADNMTTYAKLFNVPDVQGAVEALLRRFELWERRSDRAALLSKGMKQKLALARALVHDPDVVLLDEPTANLDPQTARAVRELIGDLRDRGCAVIVSTHNLDEVERVASRVGLISTRLIAVGEPATLRRELFGRRLRVTLAAGADDFARFAEIAALHGAHEVQRENGGLTMRLDDPDRSTPAIIAALVGAGAAIREARDEEPTLEELYLKLLERGAASA
jgi:ABC-2 type transport system ATP-binding protein